MGESKQVKVDNWGIFFLQRLQHFFNKTYFCDLTLQFEDNVQLKVHRLVMNACTEYFQMLEQTCEVINDCLIMPPDLQADVVVPIVNFMYTGILEFQESIFDRLYTTARLMNMTVLTKLLDAQKVPISPIHKPINKRTTVSPITWNLQGKRIAPKTMDPDLPEPLPGRKLPIWKRKSVPNVIGYHRSDQHIATIPDPISSKYYKTSVDDTPRPTRFEWPEEDDTTFDTSSFDEISYTSKPIILPSREKSPKPSTSNFEELKRSSTSIKRSASPIYNDSKKLNMQDVKEYLKEQKLRSDYIDYDDSEAADNDLQTYENNDDDSQDETNKDSVFDQNDDSHNKSILKNDITTSHNKRVRFSLEGKENANSKTLTTKASATVTSAKPSPSNVDMTNHTKIITEVLKKYPHLVKKNKNIRLKILAKGSNANTTGAKPMGTPMKVVKPASKVSYMVMKPEQGNGKTPSNAIQSPDKKDGHWSCHKCSNPNPLQFDTYYLYRKHLTEVHNEKMDSQMCNICGHISRKQNMLMYHKYVKHNITPPPVYQFPKCKDCPYIALSPTLLTKHQYTHSHVNLVCSECGTEFQNKSALISHIQLTGHSDKSNSHTFDCSYCTKKFISDETLFQHIKKNHKTEARRDNIISQIEDLDEIEKKDNIITAEEIDAMDEQEIISQQSDKPKEKIKILSDVKVTGSSLASGRLLPVKSISTQDPDKVAKVEATQEVDTQQLEPSSEAESLSNVASGIAASLGLVNTIVVLDENQFILQSQDGSQENITGTGQDFILPEVTSIPNLHVSQHQVITADNNTIISQATLNKNNITSTDELVMVLTDHDYSDAANNAVITSENSNIVVLYSHPVQSQDGQFLSQPGNLMINSDMGLVEVTNNYTVENTVSMTEKQCEESIEMIQQEINNHMENEITDIPVEQTEKSLEEQIINFDNVKTELLQEQVLENDLNIPKEIAIDDVSEKMDIDPVQVHLNTTELEFSKENEIDDSDKLQVPSNETELPPEHIENQFEEPMEIEESIELIQKEIDKDSSELQEPVTETESIIPENSLNSDDLQAENTISETNLTDKALEAENILESNLTVENLGAENLISETNLPSDSLRNDNIISEENLSNNQLGTEQHDEVTKELTNEEVIEPPAEEPINELSTVFDMAPTAQETNPDVTETSNVAETENFEEDERMEVDSSKQIETTDIPIQEPSTEALTNVDTNENVEQIENNISDEIVPDSEEEKSVNEEDTQEQNNEILPDIPQEESSIQQTEETDDKEINILTITEHVEDIPSISNDEPRNLDTDENVDTVDNEVLPKMIEENPLSQTQEFIENAEPSEETNANLEESEESAEKTEQETSEETTQECSSSPVTTESDFNNTKTVELITNSKISNLLDDWDDGDTDSQQSDVPKTTTERIVNASNSINTLINDWEDEEDT